MKSISIIFTALVLCFQAFGQKENHSPYSIKFSPTQLLMGEINFAFEHRVSRQGSIEIQLGPTISEIGISGLAMEARLGTQAGVEKESRIGFLGAIAYRFYPISNYATAPRGLYIGPELKYRIYNTNYLDMSETLERAKGTATQMSFKFYTGYQFWFGNSFSMDVFTAVGLGITDITRKHVLTTYDEVTTNYGAEWKSQSKSNVTFMGSFGIKFGIGGKGN